MGTHRLRVKNRNYKELLEPYASKILSGKSYYTGIVLHYYYIVNTKNILKPTYLPVAFPDRREAMDYIRTRFESNFNNYTVERGSNVIKYKLPKGFYRSKIILSNKLYLKYQYPPWRITHQQRKDFRTIKRRNMRKWNLKLNITK